jgi:hypothetical protein
MKPDPKAEWFRFLSDLSEPDRARFAALPAALTSTLARAMTDYIVWFDRIHLLRKSGLKKTRGGQIDSARWNLTLRVYQACGWHGFPPQVSRQLPGGEKPKRRPAAPMGSALILTRIFEHVAAGGADGLRKFMAKAKRVIERGAREIPYGLIAAPLNLDSLDSRDSGH